MPICKKCNQKFPFQKKINGKTRNLGNRSYCLNCSPFGSHNTKKLEMGSVKTSNTKICPSCEQEKSNTGFYQRTDRVGLSQYCKKCSNTRDKISQSKRAINRKLNLVKLLGGCCSKCGYDKNLAALIFHHIRPKEKMFGLSVPLLRRYTWKACLIEAKKCILLCSNCHAEMHYPDYTL